MSARPYLPNLLSSLRVTLAPAILGAAYSNSKTGFVILVAVAIVTDAIDGHLARRWGTETPIGRRLDHWGDALTMCMGALGLFLLWEPQVEREWEWALLAALACFAIGVDKLWWRPDHQAPPPWWERVLGLVLPLSLIPFLAGWSPWPFRAAAVLQAMLAIMELWERRQRTENKVRPPGEAAADHPIQLTGKQGP